MMFRIFIVLLIALLSAIGLGLALGVLGYILEQALERLFSWIARKCKVI